MVPMKTIDRRFGIETPAFDGLFKEVQSSRARAFRWFLGLRADFYFPKASSYYGEKTGTAQSKLQTWLPPVYWTSRYRHVWVFVKRTGAENTMTQ